MDHSIAFCVNPTTDNGRDASCSSMMLAIHLSRKRPLAQDHRKPVGLPLVLVKTQWQTPQWQTQTRQRDAVAVADTAVADTDPAADSAAVADPELGPLLWNTRLA